MRYIIIYAIAGLFVFGCKEKPPKKILKEVATNNIKEDQAKNIAAVSPCVACDSIYNAFPKDSTSFEKIYGYPSGLRRIEDYEDIEAYFKCLDNCFDYDRLSATVKLSSEIKYDADGPSYIQQFLVQYLKKDLKNSFKLYSELGCRNFKRHVAFLYAGIEVKSYVDKQCDFFSSLKLDDDCKEAAVKEHCEKDYPMH